MKKQGLGGSSQKNESSINRKVRFDLRFMACPLCKNTCKEATTINRCLHSFCKECIYLKVHEGMKECPVCQEDLSSLSPDDYLRPDENYQGLIAAILGQASRNREKEKVPSDVLGAHKEEQAHGNTKLAEHSIHPKDADAPASSADQGSTSV